VPQVREALADRPEVGDRGRLDDRHRRLGVLHAVLERLGPEEVRKRQRDRAHLEHGHVGDRGLGTLRQDDGDAIAAFHAERRERVG
jgi:hypothetical protein